VPFAAVASSSGMGKTQFAFSLSEMGRPYLYWTAKAAPSVDDQPIYSNFRQISYRFERFVRKDIEICQQYNEEEEEENEQFPTIDSAFWINRSL